MKAVIMEIYKDYCIVMTKDGQFLKQGIPAGIFEIGDEIVVSEGYVYRPNVVKVGWMKSFAVGTMVVVIVAVISIFGIVSLKQYRSSRGIALSTEDTTGETLTTQIEEEAQEETEEESALLSMEAEQEGTIIFEKTYSLEEEAAEEEKFEGEVVEEEELAEEEILEEEVTPKEKVSVEDNIKGIIFSYEIIDNVSLRVKLENKSYTPDFNGTFKLVFLFSDEIESRTETIILEGFELGKVIERPLFLKAEETDMRLIVTEITY